MLTPVFVFTVMRVKLLSEDLPARKGKLCVSLGKQKYLMKLAVIKKGKMHQVCFFCHVGDCKYS